MRLNHISIIVKDVEKSKKFYKEMLGLECTFEQKIGGQQFSKVIGKKNVELKFAVLQTNSDVILELVQFINTDERINNDFRHIAFEVLHVDELYKKLKDKKIETLSEPVTITDSNEKINGKRFFYFKDLDGNLVELFNKKENLYSN